MHTHLRLAGLGALLVALGTASFADSDRQAARRYRVHGLDSLGGPSSRGNGINDWGLVAGFSDRSANMRRAAVWFGGRVHDLGTLGGTNSSIAWSGLSNTGLAVGIAQTDDPQTRKDGWSCRGFFPGSDSRKFTCLGVVWEWGRIRELPGIGGDNSFATAANSRSQVVGWAERPESDPTCLDPTDRGFTATIWDLHRNRVQQLLPYADDSASAATAISERGQVVGISGDCDQSIGRRSARHAVLWDRGTVTDLGTLGTDSWNTPTAITAGGDIIVGFANVAPGTAEAPRFRAWLWTERRNVRCERVPGTNLCDLGTLFDGEGTSEAWGVNERGQVVGTSCPVSGSCRAFVWEDGRMRDLNALKGSYAHHLENAMSINDAGAISGRARLAAGFEAFVAYPERGRQ